MRKITELVVLTIWVCCTAAKETPRYRALRGDAVTLPCPFGEGELKDVFWYHRDDTGWLLVVSYYGGRKQYGSTYSEDKVDLGEDRSTLYIKDAAISDEGMYQCDVDRVNSTAIVNLYSELNIIVLPDDPVPIIGHCEDIQDTEECELHVPASTSTEISCELQDLYPSSEATINWLYEDGHRVQNQVKDEIQNKDGTFDIRTTGTIFATYRAHLWCNASFLTMEGKTTTGTSFVLIPASSKGQVDVNTVIISVSAVLVFIGIVLFIVFLIRTQRGVSEDTEKGPSTKRSPESNVKDTVEVAHKGTELEQLCPEEHHKEETKTETHVASEKNEELVPREDKTSPKKREMISHAQISKLAQNFPNGKYSDICQQLGVDYNEAMNVLQEKYMRDVQKAVEHVLNKWKNETGGFKEDLVTALQNAKLAGLCSYVE